MYEMQQKGVKNTTYGEVTKQRGYSKQQAVQESPKQFLKSNDPNLFKCIDFSANSQKIIKTLIIRALIQTK